MDPVRFAVIGVGNFAASHIEWLKDISSEEVLLTSVYIRNPEKYKDEVRKLEDDGIRIFYSFEELLDKGKGDIDVITVPTSILTHAQLSMQAMEAGYDVLCEKPPAATIQEIDRMISISKKTGCFCAVGFQNIFSYSIQRLKKMLVAGQLGDVQEMACKAYWPRYRSYYQRNDWAGKFKLGDRYVLDGPVNNALSHYLYNMLYLGGEEMNESVSPESIQAELYRGHTYIDAEDTSCLKIKTRNNIDIYFYVTHCSQRSLDPYMEIKTSKADISWSFDQNTKIVMNDGEKINFDDGGIDRHREVFRVTAQAYRKELENPYCTVENTRSFVLAVNGAYESSRGIKRIPEKYIQEKWTDEGYKTIVEDIDDIMDEAFSNRLLLSELSVDWAENSRPFKFNDYRKAYYSGPDEMPDNN